MRTQPEIQNDCGPQREPRRSSSRTESTYQVQIEGVRLCGIIQQVRGGAPEQDRLGGYTLGRRVLPGTHFFGVKLMKQIKNLTNSKQDHLTWRLGVHSPPGVYDGCVVV